MIHSAHANTRRPGWHIGLHLITVTLAGVLALIGCRQKPSPAQPDANETGTDQTAPETGTVVATINDQVITHEDVSTLVTEKMTPLQQNPGGIPQEQFDEFLRQREKEFTQEVTDTLIVEALLTAEVQRQGIAVTDEEISQRLQTSPPRADQNPAAYRKRMERDIAFRKLFETCYAGKISVSEAEARTYYQARPTRFNSPEQVRARHIQVAASQQALAESLLAQLKEGADFAILAKNHSQDENSADQGGDVGLFARQDMEKPFADAAFALQVNDLSGIVKTSYGLHLIQVTEHQPAVKRSFNDARDDIVTILTEQKKRVARQAYVQSLRKQADIAYN